MYTGCKQMTMFQCMLSITILCFLSTSTAYINSISPKEIRIPFCVKSESTYLPQNELKHASFSLLNPTPHPPAGDVYLWLRECRHRYIAHLPIVHETSNRTLLLLIISGIEPNPGPKAKFPCAICSKACKLNSIACDDCNQWLHKVCLGMSSTEFSRLGNSEDTWICPNCSRPNNSTILYSVPEDSDSSSRSVNLSTHPSALDSLSDISLQSRSSTSTEPDTDPSFASSTVSDNPAMASSPKTPRNIPQKRKQLRLLVINFQSLRKKGKLLESIIESSEPDVLLGTETWLDDSIKSSEIIPNYLGYDVQRRDRKSDQHGGVLIAAKRELQPEHVQISKEIEMISCTIKTADHKKVKLAAYYRPPNRVDEKYLNTTMEEITLLRNSCKKDICLIGGDFNLPDIDWCSLRTIGNQYPARVSQLYLDIVADNSFEQQVTFPTRKDKTLDLLFTTHPSFTQRCKPIPSIGNSDHDIVLYDTTLTPLKPKPQRRKIFLWKQADVSAIKNDVADFSHSFATTAYTDINSMWEGFTAKIKSIMEIRVPTKMTLARHTHPWMNRNIRRGIRRKQRAHKKARTTGKKRDRDRYKMLQQQTQFEIRRADRKYMEDASDNYTENPKKFWSLIKSKGQEASGVSALKNKEGYMKSDNKSKAEILNDQFQSVYTREDTSNLPDKGPSPHQTMDDIEISRHGVFKLLAQLKPHKATGPDCIPAFILRAAAHELAPILTLIYQRSLDTGVVPDDWRNAWIVPVYKKGEKHIAANYRPVSLTSITCKILEHIIHSSIMTHFDNHNILCDNQHGFRKKRSCETQLLVTIEDIVRRRAKGNQVDIILLDFAKAFDKVPHSRLLYKMAFYGVRGNTNRWIRSFLSDRKQQVVLEGCHSTSADVLSGVPQGTVLGPLLFLSYINDLPDSVISSETRLFADDSLLYRHVTNQHDRNLLQNDLTALEAWEKTWQMSFNASKCSVIRISPSKRSNLIQTSYTLHGQTLEVVDGSKYLGVTITSDLSWTRHCENVVGKGNRSLGFLRRNFKDCTPKVKAATYTTMVRPALEYASTVWDPHLQRDIKALEQVQRRAARYVTKDYTSRTPGCVTAMVHNLQWETLEDRRKHNRLHMLYKIQNNLVDINSTSFIQQGDSRTRGSQRLFQERITDVSHYHSFFPRTIRDWNQLPSATTTSETLGAFKTSLGASLPDVAGTH